MTGYLRAAWRALTWRRLLLLQALGQLVVFLDSREERPFGSWIGHPSESNVAMMVSVFLLAPIAVIADEAVNRGVRARVMYPLAVASTLPVTLLAAALTQHLYLGYVQLPSGTSDLFWQSVVTASFHMYIYGAFGMLVYMNQRTADRLLENFRSSELRRAQLERQLAESSLAAAEAQIDPAQLFTELASIKRSLGDGRVNAEGQLAELIQTLRQAMARTTALSDSATARPS